MKENNNFQVTKTNLIFLLGSVIFLIFSVQKGLNDADKMLKEKEKKFAAMDISEIGKYIVSKNSMVNKIDPITSIRPTTYKNKTLTIIYDVKDGFFYRTESSLIEIEKKKINIQKELVNENCTKTAHKMFIKKGGRINYTYYLFTKGKYKYLFNFKIDNKSCNHA